MQVSVYFVNLSYYSWFALILVGAALYFRYYSNNQNIVSIVGIEVSRKSYCSFIEAQLKWQDFYSNLKLDLISKILMSDTWYFVVE